MAFYYDHNILTGCTENIDAHTIKGYMVHNLPQGTTVHIPYPKDTGGSLMEGKGFHYGRFVMALRKAAMSQDK